MTIATVISFYTNDFRFLKACIEEARLFSEAILIMVCDHFFDGSPENYALLEHAYRLFPDCQFIEYAFDPEVSYRAYTPYYPEHPHWRHEWANTSRWISYFFLPKACTHVLFLDVDEIVEGTRFKEWLATQELSSYAALSFAAHWYFREASNQATRQDDISLLVNRDALTPDHLWHSDERAGILIGVEGKKRYGIQGLDDRPLIHHYSWVRTEQELYKKFATWSHHWERPWQELTEKEYSGPFQGKDFIRGYTYHQVPPYFDPLSVAIPTFAPITWAEHCEKVKQFSHVIRVERKEMQRKEILACL